MSISVENSGTDWGQSVCIITSGGIEANLGQIGDNLCLYHNFWGIETDLGQAGYIILIGKCDRLGTICLEAGWL